MCLNGATMNNIPNAQKDVASFPLPPHSFSLYPSGMVSLNSPHPVSFFRRAILPRLVFLLLILPVAWAYVPAQTRVFSSDQLYYLAELDGDRSLDAGFRLLDYSAKRRLTKGDELLYRPLLMAVLAVENAIFQLDYRAWNLANIAFLLILSWTFFEILWRRHHSPLAHAAAIWFAALTIHFELVTWCHLGGYLLGYTFLLLALESLRIALLGQRPRAWIVYATSIFAAMLFHEIAVVAALLSLPFAAVALRSRPVAERRISLLPLLVPPTLFAILYVFHVLHCERWLWLASSGPSLSLWSLPLRIGLAFWLWASRSLLPAAVEFVIRPLDRCLWRTPQDFFTPLAIAAQLALWAGVLLALRHGLSRARFRDAAAAASFLSLLLLAYSAMNWSGRAYVLNVSYYTTFFALFGSLLLLSFVDASRLSSRATGASVALLLTLAALNLAKVRETARACEVIHSPFTTYFDSIATTINPFLNRPDFSFAILNPPPMDMAVRVTTGYSDTGTVSHRLASQMLYGRLWNPLNPSICLDWAPAASSNLPSSPANVSVPAPPPHPASAD